MTAYYGVIGNRDHIKYKGEKRPFWEFLDKQPDGFLSSLAYLPLKDFPLPEGNRIFDCGAWSYKNDLLTTEDRSIAAPKLKKLEVTPQNVLKEYQRYANSSDLLIAPDHMLIPVVELEATEIAKVPDWVPLHVVGYRTKINKSGVKHIFSVRLTEDQLNARREFNLRSAREFYPLAIAAGLTPMATVHGMSLEERLVNVGRLYEIGYRHFSLGGLAARASQKASLLASIQAISDKVRSFLPDAWIHVLGLSSPEYFSEFNRMAIDSCDGSSHFKQAFTAKTFFGLEDGKLVKLTASMEGVSSSIPECSCTACLKLRGDGIDTRQFGTNQHNMGRAAHNLNMLMQAQVYAVEQGRSIFQPSPQVGQSTQSITLVSCVGKKQSVKCAAKDLYQSDWFLKCRSHVESQGWDWYVISAKHGLIHRDEAIEPYEMTLNEMKAAGRKEWSDRTFNQILKTLPDGGLIRIFAGKKYREYLQTMLINAGYQVEVPLEGLGIGQQLAWFDGQRSSQLRLF